MVDDVTAGFIPWGSWNHVNRDVINVRPVTVEVSHHWKDEILHSHGA